MKIVLLAAAFLATSALGLNIHRHEAPSPKVDSAPADKAQEAECRKSGGRYKREGIIGTWGCVKSYKDAYKLCSSSDEC